MWGISDSLRDLNAYLAMRVAVLIKTQFRLSEPARLSVTSTKIQGEVCCPEWAKETYNLTFARCGERRRSLIRRERKDI